MPICLRNTTPLLALYCHPNDPVAGTVLLHTDFCCFHLQLNQHFAAFLQRHKHIERTASVGMYGQRQDSMPICLRNRPCAGTALPHTIDKPIVPICLRPTNRMIVPVCLRPRLLSCRYACETKPNPITRRADTPTTSTTNQTMIAPIRLLSPPDACTVLLPRTDKDCAATPTVRPNDSADTPAITTRQ